MRPNRIALRIVLMFNEIAAFVIAVARTGIFLQQIVQHLRQRDGTGELFLLRRIGCLDVAGRIKRKGFMAQGAVRPQQPPERVVTVFDAAAPAVVDAGQLAGRIVVVAPPDRRLHAGLDLGTILVGMEVPVIRAELRDGAGLLFDQAPGRVVLEMVDAAVFVFQRGQAPERVHRYCRLCPSASVRCAISPAAV